MTIKIISLNLWLGGLLFDEILVFLKRENADIVVLQEVANGTDAGLERQHRSLQVLEQELGYKYSDFAAVYRDFDHTDGKAERGNAILSKFPITARDNIFFDGSYTEIYRDVPGNYQNCPHNLQHVVLNTPVGNVNVFNIQGVWDMDGDSYSEKRRHMVEVIVDEVQDKPRVILAGDTNAKMTNQAILDIEEYLINVFGRELPTTFNMRHKDNPGYGTAAVDAIFVSRDIKVLEKACHDDDISDHRALSAVLNLS